MTRGALRRRGLAAAGVLAAAGLLALGPAAGASAHDYLVSSTPKDGSTQTTALSDVVLTFNDRVLDLSGDGSSNVVEVTSGGKHYEAGCPTIADTAVTTPVSLGESGEYTVTWQVVSADGHTVSDSVQFAYVKPAGATAAAGAASRPTCGDQAPANDGSATISVSGTATPVAGQEGDTAGSSPLPLALGVGGGVIVVALIGVVVVLTRSRKGPAGGPPAE